MHKLKSILGNKQEKLYYLYIYLLDCLLHADW